MFLNLETDYAIRIVQCLAATSNKIDAKTIAAQTGVTPRFTLKILNGGYTLAKKANEITLLDVVEQVNGSLNISSCQSESGCTHPNGICCFRSVFDDVSGYMRDRFSKVTF